MASVVDRETASTSVRSFARLELREPLEREG
jgi:hypothetical protein